MQCSTLWQHIQILKLTENMQLNTANEQKREFAQWQLDIGHGRHTDETGNVKLLDKFHCDQNFIIESLIQTIYPGITFHIPSTNQYFASAPFWPVTMTMLIPLSIQTFLHSFQKKFRYSSVQIVSRTTMERVVRFLCTVDTALTHTFWWTARAMGYVRLWARSGI